MHSFNKSPNKLSIFPLSTIKKDMLANDSSTLDEDTVADYVKALKKLFVIEDLAA